MIGANREIKALSKLVRDREEALFEFFAEEGIEWSFIPPRSPNWEGLWEANIKSLKCHFKRVAGNSKFSYEELLTLITQIEAILYSRPLTPLSSDVDDLEVLTPAHFLIGRPIIAIVEPSLLQCESNRLNVWQRITKSVQTIWKRWSLEKAHFWLNGYVNKQNCRIWSEANPQVFVETPLHPEKLTVRCALWADGIIGPYFFKNDEGHNVTDHH
ncbi:integrase catalytic domain-containing protein [Trichonephila clavipes]|nr:integrase catalytic domain-containing protein [Trichonephila clavipes]